MTRKLSAVLATHNEEANLAACLESIKDLADEIVVVDGESTDKTVELARKYGARVIETTNKPMFHTNKQMAIDESTGDWILQLDADEVVDKKLGEFIKGLKQNGSEFDAFWLRRKNWFMNTFLTKGGQYPDPVIRLFKKGQAYLPQKDVHEQMVVKGETGWAKGNLLHYNAPNFARYVTNANRYTDLTAKKLHSQGVRLSIVNDFKYLAVKPLSTFLSLYLRHRGYVDGLQGFVFALFSGLHHALAYMKLGDLIRENRH
jgi:glycosyltransferase involved in cell wall biosynthesis